MYIKKEKGSVKLNEIHLKKDDQFIKSLTENLHEHKQLSSWALFKMTYELEKSFIKEKFTGLMATKLLKNIHFLPYQLETALTVIERMSGRAILADEVGLGKTIEACLVLKEYMIRGLISKALILVPSSLVNQWIRELKSKFYIDAVPYHKNLDMDTNPIIVASIDTVKKEPHKNKVLKNTYDLLIIDEAHRLKNESTLNYHFVSSIKKVYCLLLTATPIQNNVVEIFNLISIIRPGLLGNREHFYQHYAKDIHSSDENYLHQVIKNNLIRNTRANINTNNLQRNVQTIQVQFSHEEKAVYKKIDKVFRKDHTLAKINFLKQICSSREASYLSLQSLEKKNKSEVIQEIVHNIEQLPQHVKANEILNIIKKLKEQKVIVFTEYIATQHYLQWFLQNHGISSVLYNGKFSKSKKEWMIEIFKQHAQVLIATDAGSEGINLQFCHNIINYDLPWNPLKLEQRIGRVHRIGQTEQISIYNLMIKDTIEEHIMNILHQKLDVFTNVVGELERLLSSEPTSQTTKARENM